MNDRMKQDNHDTDSPGDGPRRARMLDTLLGNLPGIAYRCLNDENWTMLFVSEGCFSLTGYRAQDIVENKTVSFNDIVHPGDRDRIEETIREALAKDAHFEVIYRILRADKQERWVWERGVKVPAPEERVDVIEGFITDITRMKRIEQELVEKENALRKLKDQLEEETIYLREEIKHQSNFEEIISTSEVFRNVLKNVEKVAGTDTTVMITGETGTGKELIARAIHNNSLRSNRSLVSVNCAALPSEIIESELFGHVKGAFTGAYTRKTGRFELAHRGTLFLDEIGDLSPDLQTKLLRVIQEGEFQRLGDSTTRKVDVRILAATNRNMEDAVEEGTFRQDLYYRLNVFPIHVPPLRERKEDIPLLTRYFLRKYAAKTGRDIKEVSQKVMDRLLAYHWPGNIRELENIIERAVVVCEGDKLTTGSWMPQPYNGAEPAIPTLKENERALILRALEKTNWKVSGENGAARLLDIKRTTLEARMQKLGIHRPK